VIETQRRVRAIAAIGLKNNFRSLDIFLKSSSPCAMSAVEEEWK